mmetsp:Transcript_91618/g.200842  ORF Transcript_91618/g.200842 Transcript_91618/m.200842 type:complete len:90 (-) Transcript_91618:430-699(-)
MLQKLPQQKRQQLAPSLHSQQQQPQQQQQQQQATPATAAAESSHQPASMKSISKGVREKDILASDGPQLMSEELATQAGDERQVHNRDC